MFQSSSNVGDDIHNPAKLRIFHQERRTCVRRNHDVRKLSSTARSGGSVNREFIDTIDHPLFVNLPLALLSI